MDFDECASNPKLPIAAPELRRGKNEKYVLIPWVKQEKNNPNNHHYPRSKMGSSSHGLLTLKKTTCAEKNPKFHKRNQGAS